jgi:hypothetical protein
MGRITGHAINPRPLQDNSHSQWPPYYSINGRSLLCPPFHQLCWRSLTLSLLPQVVGLRHPTWSLPPHSRLPYLGHSRPQETEESRVGSTYALLNHSPVLLPFGKAGPLPRFPVASRSAVRPSEPLVLRSCTLLTRAPLYKSLLHAPLLPQSDLSLSPPPLFIIRHIRNYQALNPRDTSFPRCQTILFWVDPTWSAQCVCV